MFQRFGYRIHSLLLWINTLCSSTASGFASSRDDVKLVHRGAFEFALGHACTVGVHGSQAFVLAVNPGHRPLCESCPIGQVVAD
ncbi:hypothetical protein PCAR4_430022 [Paraburkholderia caribensis]|nr:hypothetical protein PCAR4_430022 [Paraburkholderia caribensis]